ncbi:hypothetical protein LXL04_006140 [Taraxacum kok-saghyz]
MLHHLPHCHRFCFPTEMEAVEGNNIITTDTLTGVSVSSPHIPSKPIPEEILRTDLNPENGGVAVGDNEVVVTTTVVEKTEVTVVTVVQEANNDVEMKEKEEGFDNTLDNHEGINVNFTDAKEKEREGVFSDLFDVDDSININFTEEEDEEKSNDPMDASPLNQKQDSGVFDFTEDKQNPENIADAFDFTEDVHENSNLQNGDKINETQEQDQYQEEYESHDYVVGDFVWGKIKSHPWWPGQIYDPSTASEYAVSIKRKNHLLVAYFGDGSFSWCSPSQLKPFIENFQEMSNQSDSKKFVHAVRTALDTIGTLIESELTRVDRVADVANGGIKPGVAVPKGNTVRVLVNQMSPVEILLKVDSYATGFEVELGLELTVVKGWLGAFYYQKGGYTLPEYHDPKCIEGLEDKSGTGDINGPSECGDDKKRKQKSVAELLLEDEPKNKKTKPAKDSGGGGGGSGRKRKAAVVPPPPLVVDSPESDMGTEEDSMCSPRQRRKSKYLSPPYLSPTTAAWSAKLQSGSGSSSFKEPKPEPEKEKEKEKESDETSSPRRKPRQKRMVTKDEGKVVIDSGVDVDRVLSGLLIVALDPSGSVEKKKLLGVTRFVSSFRSSVFENGSKMDVEEEVESDVGFVKRKVEEMREIVSGFDEEEGGGISDEGKGKLEGVIMEVLERVK